MTRENLIAALRNISANFSEKGVCRFSDGAAHEKALGFIDTSQGQNGSRGIVFFDSRAVVNFDGNPREIPYRKIRDTQIISSSEDVFSDELAVLCDDGEVRISDFSLNKTALKGLLDALCADYAKNHEHKFQAEQLASIIAENLAESALFTNAPTIISEPIPEKISPNVPELPEKQPDEALSDIIFEDGAPVISEINSETVLPAAPPYEESIPEEALSEDVIAEDEIIEETFTEEPIPENAIPEADVPPRPEPAPAPKINWISGDLRTAVIEKPKEPPLEFKVVDRSEDTERLKIENMSREETMSYLAESLDEINATSPEPQAAPQTEDLRTINDYTAPEPQEEPRTSTLTVEPFWGDIYIKASRNLRELCESGKLSMAQIEAELNSRLLDSARAFAEITSDKAKVPKVLIPKITELKAAAYSFDSYFQLGEDIAVRAMFFMQYQMLSYADRIAETPETKERLNNFFRRFGPAGITLSMLDMRV